MKTIYTIKNFAKRLVMMLAVGLLAVNAWGTTITNAVYTFGSGSTPSGWSVGSSNTHVANYLKFSSGDYLEMTTASIFTSGEVLSSTNMQVEVSCGTFGTWSGSSYSVKCTVELRNSSGTVLSTANATFSGLNNNEGTYRTAINVAKPADPSAIAKLRITFTNFTTGTTLRVKNVRLNYSTAAAATYNVYLMSGCTGGSYSSNKGTSGSGTGAYSSCTKYSGISAGTSVTITAAATSGYQFDGWEDSGYSIIFDDDDDEITPSSTTSTTATFTMPSKDVVIWYCNFSESCSNSVTVSNGGSSTNGSITSITTSPVATCSSTASDRQVSILVMPSTGYVAPTALTVASSTGTVNATKISRTDNGNGTFTFVYQFAQNDNGTISYNAACVGKQCTITFDKNSGTGGDNSVTATYGSAMTDITPPTREHFDFEGYYDSESNNNGTGNKYYNSDGSSAATWNKNTTSNTTLYAKWTEHGLKNYRTVCCTELGYIHGIIQWPTPTKATIIWDAMSNVAVSTPYAVTYRTGSDSYSSTNVSAIRDTLSTKKYCTITGLTAGTSYDFKIAVTAAANYCDKDSVITATAPKITVSGTPSSMSYVEGDGPSDPESFSVSGVGLTGNLTVTAPTNFEVCKTSDGTYTSSVTLTPTSGTVSSTTIYVRLVEDLDINSYGPSNVSISGGSAATVNVSVSGVVSASCHTPTISANPSGATYNMSATATALSVSAAKGDEGDPNLTYQWYVSATNDNTAGSVIVGETSSTYTPPTTTAGTKYYYCVVYSGACSKASKCAAVTVNTPTLTASVSSCAFSTKKIGGTYTMTLTISGTNLAKDATVAYAIGGDDDDMFSVTSPSSPISQTSTGALSATTVTVQYAPTSKADHSATLTFSSTGASNVVVNLTGTGQYEDTYMTAMHEADDEWEDYAEGVSMAGDGYTIPNPGDVAKAGTGCEEIHYHFAGWVTNANKEAGTISGNIIPASGTTDATGTTYWAVWEKEAAGSGTLTKLTSSYVPTEGDNLVIVAKGTTVALYQSTYSTNYVQKWTFDNDVATVSADDQKYITLESDGEDGWYLGDGTNGYLYNGSSNDLATSTSDKTSFTIGTEVVSDVTYFTFNSGRWLSYRSDLSTYKYYRLGGSNAKASEANGNALFDLYKYVGLSYEDPKVECICSANPSAGTAAVDATGTFSASSIAVKATGANTGHADCSYTDYGFVWSTSVTTPTLVEATGAASTNCTKVQVGTSGEHTSFTGSLTGSFTANPIYLRSYVKNGKADGSYQYSSVVTINPRSVTFDLNGHGSSAPATQLVNNGSKATDPSYSESVTGYIFGGWYKEAGCSNVWTFGTDVVSGENKTLYAKWTPITYSVRFNSNDANYLGTATGSMSDQSFDYDESKDLTGINFSLAGYDFAGWALTPTGDVEHLDEAEVENLSSTNSAVVDLYAIWTAKKYNVTLAATNETSSVGSQTVQATYNAEMPLVTTADGTPAVAAPSRTGYTFTGWEYSSTTYYNYNAGTSTLTSAHVWDQPNSTTTLTPKWSINSYTLTWDLAGGTVSVEGTGAAEGATGTPSSSVEYNSAITAPTVTKAGYNFAGWDVTPASNMPAAATTYTATWTAKAMEGWTWKYKKGNVGSSDPAVVVPDVVEAYIGEYVRFIIDGYTPSDLLDAKRGYVYINEEPKDLPVYNGDDLAQVGKDGACSYYTTRGKKAVSSTTLTFKAVGDNSITQTFTLKINALPTVTFVDNIHNKDDFSNSGDGYTAATGVLSSTVTSGVVSHAGKTPTHADVAIPVSGNACEQSHLHLIGWIRSDYSKVAAYMEGTGDAPTVSELTGAGTGYWFLPNADINVETYNGKTFYAVWAVEE